MDAALAPTSQAEEIETELLQTYGDNIPATYGAPASAPHGASAAAG